MSADTDFLAFYQQLQVHASCSVAELKRAYRRRVAELHPDRNASAADAAATTQLQELTAAYAAAMAFQRRHGRLPGAPTPGDRGFPGPLPAALPVRGSPLAGSGGRLDRGLWALAIVAAFGWSLLTDNQAPADGADEAMSALTSAVEIDEMQIMLGTSKAQVQEWEGVPTARNRQHWDYGPSWVEFEGDAVSNWYSSPRRPLHVATAHPSAAPHLR